LSKESNTVVAEKKETKKVASSKTVKLKPSDYVHLHNHSHFSILDGLQKIPEMVAKTKEYGMEAIAVTDHGTMGAAIELYKKCKSEDIKPIIGSEFYVAARKHTDKEKEKDKERFHLILLATNEIGYKNLCKLTTISYRDGYYFKPRIDHDLLRQYSEGIICLSGCIGGEVGSALRNGHPEKAKEIINLYKEIFPDRYYLELQDHGHHWEEQKKVNDQLLKLSDELSVPAVVTCDAHYLEEGDQDVHEVLLCVSTASNLDDPKRFSLKDTNLFLTDPKDLIERWSDHPELILNTKKIADQCNLEFELGKILIPKFETEDGSSEEEALHKMVWQGLAWRYGKVAEEDRIKLSIEEAKKTLPEEIIERTNYELGVIDNMGFNGYFLIVQDFINWGKKQGIIFGPGRGSAAGSIIAYAIRITEIDPLKYDLLFERFLNPDRISMPDIDIDIEDSRRSEVIQYCIEKYGVERVANIGTYGIMAARAAVRDVGRVLGIPLWKVDALAKIIPPPVQGRHIPLKKSLQENNDLKNAYNDPENKQILDIAVRLEGTIRNSGVHAAGVVIAPTDITDYAPLYVAKNGGLATQYTMNPIEDLGLLKMDFLGLSNLTIINNALRIIRKVYGNDIDIDSLPLDDPKTFELLQRADTTGVFQLESGGMRKYLKQLIPKEFEDIAAMTALYRPGPIQFIPDFIERKNGRQDVSYDHPGFEAALKNTYGILVYQEQFMQISKDMCGFTGGQADTLRKAVGKKNRAMMDKVKPDFVEGMITHSGVPREFAEKFWSQLEAFADYCFNKAHSVCYGLIAYQTAYLKAHYPDAFMASLMTSDADNIDRLTIEISDCKKSGIKVMNPDVNESFSDFAIVKGENKIRFGLGAIKNVGHGAAERIIEEREAGGIFKDLEDFFARIPSTAVNKKVIESLIRTGGFDSFGYSRQDLLNQLETLISFSQRRDKEALSNQVSLFGDSADSQTKLSLINSGEEAPQHEKLNWERELLGLYLSSHPLDKYKDYLDYHTENISELKPEEVDGASGVVGGIISASREITTKKGDRMAFMTLADIAGEIELIIFPQSYTKFATVLNKPNAVLITKGKFDAKDRDGNLSDELKMMVNEVEVITEEDLKTFDPNNPNNTSKKEETTESKKRTTKKQIVHDGPGSKLKLKKESKVEVNESKEEKKTIETIYIKIVKEKYENDLLKLKKLAESEPGAASLVLVFGQKPSQRALKLPFKLNLTPQTRTELSSIFSSENLSYN
jgi:DNA polymerase-3 subunit alpha